MRVTIDNLAERRLWAFIRATKVEVGGMGYAFLHEDEIHWAETFLIPQEVSAGEVDFEKTGGESVAIERAEKDGVLDESNFVWVSWHSHHTMDAFWSSTDDKRIAAMHAIGVKRLLSFVGCHDGTYKMRVDVFGVAAHDVNIGQVTVSALELDREPDEFEKAIEAEFSENVVEKTYTSGKLWDAGSWYDSAFDGASVISPGGSEDHRRITNGSESEDRRRIASELEAEGIAKNITEAWSMLDNLGIDDCEDQLYKAWLTDDASLKSGME